jgi:ribosome recycling factor
LDADKVRRDIAAQGVITEELRRQTSRTVQAYAEQKRAELRTRYYAATDPQQKRAVQAEVDELRLETHVLHVLIGAVTGV